MKWLIIFLFPLMSFSQSKIILKKDTGYFTLSLGLATHTFLYFTHKDQKLNPKQKVGLGFGITVGLGLEVMSFELKRKKYKPKL
jgi:hypothetical protein